MTRGAVWPRSHRRRDHEKQGARAFDGPAYVNLNEEKERVIWSEEPPILELFRSHSALLEIRAADFGQNRQLAIAQVSAGRRGRF